MKFLVTFLMWWSATACLAAQVDVNNVRMWPAPDHTRVVFDITGPLEHRLFTLEGPDRVVIDLIGASVQPAALRSASSSELIARVRSAVRGQNDLRFVLDLSGPVRPKSFLLKPNSSYGHRLVIDLFPIGVEQSPTPDVSKQVDPGNAEIRDIVIAIDPGHGGDDPGASGPRGTREKQVTLALAQRLAKRFDQERGMRGVLIRNGDYYVGLRKRMKIARDNRADLFISIHADAFRDPRVHGSSVYILSRNGASSEAGRWLAEQENAADLAGGVSLDDKDDLLASVLLDLSQTATLTASTEVGKDVLEELKRLGKPIRKGSNGPVLWCSNLPISLPSWWRPRSSLIRMRSASSWNPIIRRRWHRPYSGGCFVTSSDTRRPGPCSPCVVTSSSKATPCPRSPSTIRCL